MKHFYFLKNYCIIWNREGKYNRNGINTDVQRGQ